MNFYWWKTIRYIYIGIHFLPVVPGVGITPVSYHTLGRFSTNFYMFLICQRDFSIRSNLFGVLGHWTELMVAFYSSLVSINFQYLDCFLKIMF